VLFIILREFSINVKIVTKESCSVSKLTNIRLMARNKKEKERGKKEYCVYFERENIRAYIFSIKS